ncbi:hypothetical protein V8J88_24690 [Massilia sp. W12]|uniref:hypothetical protein n=1 Tax=Massilia sp. W12 TaxID=3126507 RepID=UPI0030CD6424
MQQALARALHVTSDKAILAYTELLQDELRVLLQRNDDSCHRYLFPLPAQAPLPPLPSALAERNSVIVAQILRDAAKQAQAALSNQRMQALRFAVIGPWANAHPQQFQMLSNPHLPADKQAVCRAAQSLYAHIQNQHLEAAPVLRMMLGRSTR